MAIDIDDLPHPVPDLAKLRWKENWLFVVMAPEQQFYALCHINTEPGFDRARFTLNMVFRGARYAYASERPFSGIEPLARTLGDGAVTLTFLEPGKAFRIDAECPEFSAVFHFSATHETFDFASCRAAAPHNLSFREAMTLGTNLPHDHHQQALRVSGMLKIPKADVSEQIEGLGYRDHSYCMRGDTLIASHSWNAFLFDDLVIGVKTAQMVRLQGAEAREGYVIDKDGTRVISHIQLVKEDAGGEWQSLRFDMTCVAGRRIVIEADLRRSIATLPFLSEKQEAGPVYRIVEHLCPVREIGSTTKRDGWGHIELGRNSAFRS